MKEQKKKVYVVCENDFPLAVFFEVGPAFAYAKEKQIQWEDAGERRRVYYHVQEAELHESQ